MKNYEKKESLAKFTIITWIFFNPGKRKWSVI